MLPAEHTPGRICVVKLPTNHYEEDTSERDVLLALFEEMRAIRIAVVIVSIVAVPLMLLGVVKLLF